MYLGGAIKDKTDAEIHGWRNQIRSSLIAYPITIFDPSVRDYQGALLNASSLADLDTISEEIVTLDTEEINASQVLLCNFPSPSAGSAMEIYIAWTLRKLVITMVPNKFQVSPWVHHHSTRVVETYPQALQELKNFFPTTFGVKNQKDLQII